MSKFKIGDRVKVHGYSYYDLEEGDTGTVVEKLQKNAYNVYDYAVRMDKESLAFHDCDNRVEFGHGLFFNERHLTLIKDEQPDREFKVIITSKGDTTTAKVYHGENCVREAKVNRYYKDKYSEEAAIAAVLEKLYSSAIPKEQPKKYFTGKVVCIQDDSHPVYASKPHFLAGRVYFVDNGVMKGERLVSIKDIVSVEALNKISKIYKFIELKE